MSKLKMGKIRKCERSRSVLADIVHYHGPFHFYFLTVIIFLLLKHSRFETIKAAPPAQKKVAVSEETFKGSPQAQAGRQLTKEALLPVLKNVRRTTSYPPTTKICSHLDLVHSSLPILFHTVRYPFQIAQGWRAQCRGSRSA